MAFRKIEPEKLADSVVRQIEELILQGVLRPGERLPSERELSERLGVSRPSLREAIAALQDKALLTSRVGSGIYVAEVLGSAFSPALVALFKRHERAVDDYLTFRRDLEGLAAERATLRASDTDLAVVSAIFDKMQAAHRKRDPSDEARLDAQFHLAIIEASHNIIMLHMMRSMFDLLTEGVFYNRQIMFQQRATRDTLLNQHGEISAALLARNPELARGAVEKHLDYVRQCLTDQRRAEDDEAVARQRLEHEQERQL